MQHINYKEELLIKNIRSRKSKLDYEDIFASLKAKKLDMTVWEMGFIDSLENFTEWTINQRRVLANIYSKYFGKVRRTK